MRAKRTVLSLFACLMVVAPGCASIVNRDRPLSITSNPSGAAFTIYDKHGRAVHEARTPATVTLPRDVGYFSSPKYTVDFTRGGYPGHTATIPHDVSGWYVGGNFLFGGLIGWVVVDPLTGAMWTLKDLNVDLDSTAPIEGTRENKPSHTADGPPIQVNIKLGPLFAERVDHYQGSFAHAQFPTGQLAQQVFLGQADCPWTMEVVSSSLTGRLEGRFPDPSITTSITYHASCLLTGPGVTMSLSANGATRSRSGYVEVTTQAVEAALNDIASQARVCMEQAESPAVAERFSLAR